MDESSFIVPLHPRQVHRSGDLPCTDTNWHCPQTLKSDRYFDRGRSGLGSKAQGFNIGLSMPGGLEEAPSRGTSLALNIFEPHMRPIDVPALLHTESYCIRWWSVGRLADPVINLAGVTLDGVERAIEYVLRGATTPFVVRPDLIDIFGDAGHVQTDHEQR